MPCCAKRVTRRPDHALDRGPRKTVLRQGAVVLSLRSSSRARLLSRVQAPRAVASHGQASSWLSRREGFRSVYLWGPAAPWIETLAGRLLAAPVLIGCGAGGVGTGHTFPRTRCGHTLPKGASFSLCTTSATGFRPDLKSERGGIDPPIHAGERQLSMAPACLESGHCFRSAWPGKPQRFAKASASL